MMGPAGFGSQESTGPNPPDLAAAVALVLQSQKHLDGPGFAKLTELPGKQLPAILHTK